MVQQWIVRLILLPFSMLYGLGISIRDLLHRIGLLKGVRFDIPIISVGNLSIGGAGKTPHIEYLVRLLSPYLEIVTLSRGYKRSTKGMVFANASSDAKYIGDEPMQYVKKFPEILVTVAESRAYAIPQILVRKKNTQLILLDDAFQHRSVDPGLNILLTQFQKPFSQGLVIAFWQTTGVALCL